MEKRNWIFKSGKYLLLTYFLYKVGRFIRGLIRKQLLVREYSKWLQVPRSCSSPIVGFLPYFKNSLPRFLHGRMELFDEATKQANGVRQDLALIGTPFTRTECIIFSRDAKVTKFILKDEFDSFVKTEISRTLLRDFIGEGIFVINHGSSFAEENKLWLFQRKVASKIFTKNVFNGHVNETLLVNLAKLEEIVKKSETSGAVDMKKLFYEFTMDAIGNIGFGVDFGMLGKNGPFGKAFDEVIYDLMYRTFLPFYETLGRVYPSERRLRRNITLLQTLSSAVIKERKNDPNIEEKGDILSLFLQADPTLNDKLLQDIIMSFLIAGRDTTACTLTFALFLLATHPESQEKLFEELSSTFSANEMPTLDSLKTLRYLDGVIFESLRLFPPVPADFKTATKTVTLPNGMKVYKGTTITFEPFVVGRDENRFEKAGSFVPERWIISTRQVQEFDHFEFPMFQAGPRICIGKDLAFFEAKMVLTHLVRKFKFTPLKEDSPTNRKEFEADVSILNGEYKYKLGVTLSFNGPLNLIVSRR